jgi:hypothetical protein
MPTVWAMALRQGKLLPPRESFLIIIHFPILTSGSDPANFINFCTGKTLTNGLQVKGGSCNGIGRLSNISYVPSNSDHKQSWETSPQPTRWFLLS